MFSRNSITEWQLFVVQVKQEFTSLCFVFFFSLPSLPIPLSYHSLLCVVEWSQHREGFPWVPEAPRIFIKIRRKMALSIIYFALSDLRTAIPAGKDGSQEEVALNHSVRISRVHLENLPAACHLFSCKGFSSVKNKTMGWVRWTESEVSFFHVWLADTALQLRQIFNFFFSFLIWSMNSL